MNKTGIVNPAVSSGSKRGTPTVNPAQGDGMKSKGKLLKATASHSQMEFDGGINSYDAGGKKPKNS